MTSDLPEPLTPEQLFALAPEERAQAIAERNRRLSLDDLDPVFRTRVVGRSQQLIEEMGLAGGGSKPKT